MEDKGFQVVKGMVQPDGRGRVSLGMMAAGKNYRVMTNDAGQKATVAGPFSVSQR